MRHLDLFSGIGGFALAVRWLGHETVGFCEIDPWCRRVLDKHWPEVPKHDDIKTLRGDQFGAVDLVTGGYPCQPFSLAGKRAGANDDRHLWPQMRRVIDEARPSVILAENVAGHISMGLDTVLAEMEADGYSCGAVVIPAAGVNALHKRERIWIMAHAEGYLRGASGDGRHVAPDRARDSVTVADAEREPEERPQQAEPIRSEWATRMGRSRGSDRQPELGTDTSLGHADEPRLEGWQLGGERAGERAFGQAGSEQAGRRGPEVARALDAGPDGLPPRLVRSRWADGTWEVDLPRVATHEHERRQKLQAAGNAIVPQVAYEILRVMIGEAA